MPDLTPTKGERCHFRNVEEMADFISKRNVDLVDAVFCDPIGTWHHCTYATSQCEVEDLKSGFAFDGSSIRLFTSVDNSDMLMVPGKQIIYTLRISDPTTCWIDPFTKHRTLHVICDIYDSTKAIYSRCPRQIAKRAANVLKNHGIADYCNFGPEPEFFIFDHVRFKVGSGVVSAEIEGSEAADNNAEFRQSKVLFEGPNLGNRLSSRNMYFPVPPSDTMMDLRGSMLLVMQDLGLKIEKHHHEAAAGQNELGFKFDKLVETADNVMTYKYVVKNVARQNMKTATFMPKPLYGHNGSGFHVHQSLWSNGINLFYDNNGDWGHLSSIALNYIAGILKHAWAILAFTNPTTNSYKRLVPGYEAPCRIIHSQGNRSAAIRVPACNNTNPMTKRFECRFPDGSSCPYFTFSVLLLAGVDGILNNLEPPQPLDKNIYLLSSEDLLKIPSMPTCLSQSLDALEKDHQFLLRDNVFDEEFLKSYIAFKREEIKSIQLIPHPKEFELYFNI